MSLPRPFIKFIPKIFQDDSKAINLSNKVDTDLNQWEDDIIKLKRFIRSDQCPSYFLDELNFLLSAGFQDFDSDAIKRRKIANAIATHKVRGTWISDAKKRIDNITGLSPGAAILRWDIAGTDDWILIDETPSIVDSSWYWASLGADGIDDDLGLLLVGEGTEVVIQGNIYIDCHEGINVSTLTATQINQIVLELTDDVAPAYMRIFLGYLDATGVYQQYAGGIIG